MFFFLFGCSKKDNEQIVRDQLSNIPEIAYIEAKTLLDQESFDDSLIAFKQIEKKYPLSNWALKSKIMIIFINYLKLDYENASFEVERFINKYPDYEDIDYVYYLRALIAYEQIKNPGLDALNTNKALLYFEDRAVIASNIAVIAKCNSSLPPAKTIFCFPNCINSIAFPIQ